MSKLLPALGLGCMLALSFAPTAWTQPTQPNKPAVETLPAKFDLNDVGAVTKIKAQKGGTCWTHGTMAAVESNLLISGSWKKMGQKGEPAVSEYHLDWWNGFNNYCNSDLAECAKHPSGLRPHVGGDYRVAAAYMSRGDGVVLVPPGKDNKIDIAGWYEKAPDRTKPEYQRLYVRDIEWFTIGPKLEGIDIIKKRLMTEGAIGTAMCVSKDYMGRDFFHYQPQDSKSKPNHAVAIIGWDDAKIGRDGTKPAAPKPGAWLIKNSWGRDKGSHGYYWISYYDKVACRDVEMGAVSFRNIGPMVYDHIYVHDYHGWRDTMKDVGKAFNAFTASNDHLLKAVSFYTAADNVTFTAKIFKRFEKGELLDLVAVKSGVAGITGFHTVDLDTVVKVHAKEKFYVYLELSHGGHAIDRTSEIPVLLQDSAPMPHPNSWLFAQNSSAGMFEFQPKQPKQPKPGNGPNGPLVISHASAGESYYFDGTWKDLYDHHFDNPDWATFDHTANFCMKALAVNTPGSSGK